MTDKNYIQVEIPKVPRWLNDILSQCQTNNYPEFKLLFNLRCHDLDLTKKLIEFYENDGEKTIDMAIALGVWEIE